MADNVIVNIPDTSGATIATEDIAGVQHQKVKVEFGGDGVATLVDIGTPLPVTDATAEGTLASILAKIISAPSTEAKQDALNALVTTLNSIVATAAKQDTGNTSLSSIDGKITAVNTGAVVISSSALPSGAATAARQDTGNTSLASIDTKLTNPLPVSGTVTITPSGTQDENIKQVNGQTVNVGTGAAGTGTQRVAVASDSSITANAGTNLNTSLLALASTQTDKSQFTKITDGTDTALVTAAGELNVLPTAQPGVDIGDVTINNAAGASAVNIQDGGNSITIDAVSLPLPTGASTEAKQDIGNTSLSTIAAKDFATQTTLAAFYVSLALSQGIDATSLLGVMIQGVVNDTPQSYVTDKLQPLSLTSDGRLRVSSVNSDITRVWNNTFDNPFFDEDIYVTANNYFVN